MPTPTLHPPIRAPWRLLALACGLAIFPRGVTADGADEFFRVKVEPILVARCLECHAEERRGGLDLTTQAAALRGGESGPVIVPGKPEASLLWRHVSRGEMPPQKPLGKDDVAALRRWIADGAYFPDRALDPYAFTTDLRAGYDWWSLQPIRKPKLPAIARDASLGQGAIDRFVLARLHAAGLSLSPPAERAALIRRVTYDLTGLPPSYEEVRSFVADARPDAYERLVDRLLASPRHGERWARHWLDVVRFAESNGFERDRIRTNFWPYRDYVIDALNGDVPYDQFVREQLAGDALPGAARNLAATGFLVAGPKNDVDTVSELEQLTTRQDELDDYVSTTGTTFLGLTVGCARCHDHKFDPIRARDYYSLTAVFSGLDRGDNVTASPAEQAQRDAALARLQAEAERAGAEISRLLERATARVLAARGKSGAKAPAELLPAVSVRRNDDPFDPVEARFMRFTIANTSSGSEPCLDELEVYGEDERMNVALASAGAKASASSLLPGFPIHQVQHLNDGRYGNAASWISREPRGGWAQIELPRPVKVRRVVWGRDREATFHDRLATAYRIEVSLDGRTWRQVSSHARRRPFDANTPAVPSAEALAALTAAERSQHDALHARQRELAAHRQALPALPTCYSARDGQPRPTFLLKRGNVRSRGEERQPAALAAVRTIPSERKSPQDTGPLRRLRLAEWLVDARNPLTARVLVNRLWQHHFGVGLVETPSDFGFKGGRPSHPELLDWLAADFVQHGWNMKRLHRQMVLSAVYRQSSRQATPPSHAAAAAQDGANRWLWRFSPRRLAAEELRDSMLHAAGQLDGRMGGPSFALFDYRDGNVPDYVPRDGQGPETWRRAIFMYNIRTFQPPVVAAFDCPDPSVPTPQRASSTTPLQALSLLNNRFTIEQASQLARRAEESAQELASRKWEASSFDRARAPAAHQGRMASIIALYRFVLQRDPRADELPLALEFVSRHGLPALCRVMYNLNEFLYVM